MNAMTRNILMVITAWTLWCILPAQLFSQMQDPAKARQLVKQAIGLEDEGKLDDAIKLLEEAHQLDAGGVTCCYELGYAYYVKQEYQKAAGYLETIRNHAMVDEQVFQLLGNCYDDMGETEHALKIYDEGLEKFPKSGKLFLEKGTVNLKKKDYAAALGYYEQGVEADPTFPSNYYRLAQLFCQASEDEVWGMIYGEIFMNLERNSARTAEVSKMLYDTYKSQITFGQGENKKISVSFCKNMALNFNPAGGSKQFKLPFGTAYEMSYMPALVKEKEIDINSLDRIRTGFLTAYYQRGYDKTYPNLLFEYQDRLLQAGHLEAYNHWIVMKGDEDGFTAWQSSHREQWEAFAKWYGENPLTIDADHKFYRGQY